MFIIGTLFKIIITPYEIIKIMTAIKGTKIKDGKSTNGKLICFNVVVIK
ncbi:MAG: hypothetical protein MR875_09990 [Methanobrevibacter sp.]|nr:hypothetical protein [Methanobrevibacter sp.]